MVVVRELVKATSWGAVFLLAVIILLVGEKQNIKEAIDFSFKRGAYYIINDPNVKQDIKEAIDFMSEKSTRQIRRLLADPAFRQDIKEPIDLWYAYKHNMIKPTGDSAAPSNCEQAKGLTTFLIYNPNHFSHASQRAMVYLGLFVVVGLLWKRGDVGPVSCATTPMAVLRDLVKRRYLRVILNEPSK